MGNTQVWEKLNLNVNFYSTQPVHKNTKVLLARISRERNRYTKSDEEGPGQVQGKM